MAGDERPPPEERLQQGRLSTSVGPYERDLLPALDDHRCILEKTFAPGIERHRFHVQDDSPRTRWLDEVEAECPSVPCERFVLGGGGRSFLLEPPDLRQLGLGLFCLRLLVAEAIDEALEARDVFRDAGRRCRSRRRTGGLLETPLVPWTGEELWPSRSELEDRGRDGLEEPAVVGDEDDGR